MKRGEEITLKEELREIGANLLLLEEEGQPFVDFIFKTRSELSNLRNERLNEHKHYYHWLNFIVNQLGDYEMYLSNMIEQHKCYRKQMIIIEDEIQEGSKLREFVAKGRNSL